MEWVCLSSGEIDFKWQKAVQSVCGGQVVSLARRLILNPSLNLPVTCSHCRAVCIKLLDVAHRHLTQNLEGGFCLSVLFLCTLMYKYLLFPGNTAFSIPILEILPECNKSDCVYVEKNETHYCVGRNAVEALKGGCVHDNSLHMWLYF